MLPAELVTALKAASNFKVFALIGPCYFTLPLLRQFIADHGVLDKLVLTLKRVPDDFEDDSADPSLGEVDQEMTYVRRAVDPHLIHAD